MMKEMTRKVMLFLSWRDIKHSRMGGAEIFTHEMMARSDHEQFEFIHMSPVSRNRQGQRNVKEEMIDGIRYIRKGNMVTVILHAMYFYFRNRRNIYKVVDQCNTHRFFTPLWVDRQHRMFFIHQMTREIWTNNLPLLPGLMGRAMENLMTRMYRHSETLTVSDSTSSDLIALGFEKQNIHILPEGINFSPWTPEDFYPKDDSMFTYVGRFSAYKGIDAALEAFCKVSRLREDTTFHVVGRKNQSYIDNVLMPIIEAYHINPNRVVFHGFVSEEKKLEIMSRSHCLIFPSQREGWGLTVTEAAAVGTPSIVYKSPGLVDAVQGGSAGYLTKENTVDGLAEQMNETLENDGRYMDICWAAYDFARKFSWNNTARSFELIFAGR